MRFKVGDRVITGIGKGVVTEVDKDDFNYPYLVQIYGNLLSYWFKEDELEFENEFKVGDKVKCINKDTFFYKFSEIYEIKEIISGCYYVSTLNNQYLYVSPNFFKENFEKVEEEKNDLRDLLKVGRSYKMRNGNTIDIEDDSDVKMAKYFHNQDLDGYSGVSDIMSITEKVWEREDKQLYTLKCPLTKNTLHKSIHGRLHWSQLSAKFTKKEIDELPNQKFIKTLIKEEVE